MSKTKKKSLAKTALEDFENNNFSFDGMSEEEIFKVFSLDIGTSNQNYNELMLAKALSTEICDNYVTGKFSKKQCENLKLEDEMFKTVRLGRIALPVDYLDLKTVKEFLKNLYFGEENEKLYMLILKENKIVNYIFMSEGSKSTVRTDACEINRKLNEFKYCNRIILVHNHPNALSTPSSGDIYLTQHLKSECLKNFGITIVRHYVYGTDGISIVPD